MKLAAIRPKTLHDMAFELYFLNRITDCSGCYCLTNAAGDILYVGQSVAVRQRLLQHFDSSKRNELTVYGRISRASWRPEDPVRLSALERGWLEMICLNDGVLPPLNRANAPI